MIAKALSLSVHTARGHVKSILSKLGVHSQLEAVVVAMKAGLLKNLDSEAT
jgi:DNA-binding NarL/FixJ family response regulator